MIVALWASPTKTRRSLIKGMISSSLSLVSSLLNHDQAHLFKYRKFPVDTPLVGVTLLAFHLFCRWLVISLTVQKSASIDPSSVWPFKNLLQQLAPYVRTDVLIPSNGSGWIDWISSLFSIFMVAHNRFALFVVDLRSSMVDLHYLLPNRTTISFLFSGYALT